MDIPKLKVQLRGGFSDRNGIKMENCELQTDTFDERTRTALINATNIIINVNIFERGYDSCQDFIKHILSDVYVAEVDWGGSYNEKTVLDIVCKTIRSENYDAVLTVIEYIVRMSDNDDYSRFAFEGNYYTATQFYNRVFEHEFVGYRFVDGFVTPITDEVELSSIEEATSSKYKEVRKHFEKSLLLLSNRESPDYPNSIKESISAVERMCSLIIGTSTTLGEALKKLEVAGLAIHPAMKSAFEKLYGYTSDGSGIRHSGQLGGKNSTFEEAKFMLVSCCAFVNYLTGVLAEYS